MRLDPSTGLAVWSSDACWQGSPDGQIAVLDPRAGNSAAWFKTGEVGRHVPDDYSDPEHKPWHVQTLAGERLLGDWPFNRMGGGVAAGSNNSAGQIRWADGRLQYFTGRVLFVSAEGIVGITNGDHTSIDLWDEGGNFASAVFNAPIAQGNQSESDQLDCALVWGVLTVRTDVNRMFQMTPALIQVGDYLPNPSSRTTFPLITSTGDWWVCDWDTVRITARPYNSALGIVLLDTDAEHQYFIDAAIVGNDIVLIYSYGAGQQRGDYRAVLVNSYEALPRVDVLTPPVDPGFPYTELPAPIDIGYYFYQWAPDSQGAKFDTPPDVPLSFCIPLTLGELQRANYAKVAVLAETDGVNLTVGSERNGNLTVIQRSDIYALKAIYGSPALDTQAVCQREGVTLYHYQDTPAPVVPLNWPSWAVFACQCYFELTDTPTSFVDRKEATLKRLLAEGVQCLDVTFSGYDRNSPLPSDSWLTMMQSCAGELCRRVPQIVSVTIFDGGRHGIDPPTGLPIGGSYLHDLLPAHRKLKACIPSGPSRWPVPPTPIPPILGDDMNTWATMQQEIAAACFCVGLNHQQTSDELTIGEQRFVKTPNIPPVEDWPPQQILWNILVKRWNTLTVADCVDPKTGAALTVHQISAVWSQKS